MATFLSVFIIASAIWQQPAPQESEWIVVAPEGARGKVSMPATPTASEKEMEPVVGQKISVKLQIATVDQKFTYIFAYHDQTAPTTTAELRNTLDGGVKGAIARTLGVLEKVEPITVSAMSGRQFTYTCIQGENNLKIGCRLFLDGGRMYQLTYVAPQAEYNEADAKKFLNSFARVKSETQPPPSK